ncbi:uncharacterized protein LOC126906541 isoform X3 [Daktulosphaira vitifoliae]|uniref:uncharacterized protein LOC126906541 isoform X1 n=1 Tax=Daktulosphaira vitifoliae TaxID=58002 RepID=UPI0021A99323|nr:uncharacterized protein LOC126906541 isoform X1 [Daktulosphaira vitifoliae]XP_050543076.1 uncharacterized protein LOC126906541 isoform X3 [Daktulosphaira vitifoliae]
MNCVIYFGLLLCVKSSFVISSTSGCSELIDKIEKLKSKPIKHIGPTTGEIFKQAKEKTLILGNESLSVEQISKSVKVKEIEKFENIFQYLTEYDMISIGKFIEKLQEIEDKNVNEIIKKLKIFDKGEHINVRICRQIMNNQYYPIPSDWVPTFSRLYVGFKKHDRNQTGIIPTVFFMHVIVNVLPNEEVQDSILKSLKGIDNVCYEAWLLKKRIDLYENHTGVKGLALKCLNCMTK